MAHQRLTNVLQIAAAPGTGAFGSLTAVNGRDLFGLRMATSDTTEYTAIAVDSTTLAPTGNWESGLGTWNGSALVRTTVRKSSNSDGPVNFTDATVLVFGQLSPDRNVELEPDNGIALPAASSISVPAAGYLKVYTKQRGGRMMLAQTGPSGIDTALQPFLGGNAVVGAFPNGNSTTLTYLRCALTATGTATAANWASTSLHTQMKRIDYLVTTAATTAVAGYRGAASQFSHGNAAGLGGFFYVARFGQATGTTGLSTARMWNGLIASTSAPTDVNPSTLLNALGVGYAGGTDTNWQMMYNGASGSATKIDTGIPIPTTDRADVFELAMFCAPNSQTVYWTFANLTTGTSASGSFTSPIANTTALNTVGYRSVGGTSSVVGFSLMGLYVETDY